MKKPLLVIYLLFLSVIAFPQKTNSSNPIIRAQARSQLKTVPTIIKSFLLQTSGRIIVAFDVNIDGSISDPKVMASTLGKKFVTKQ